MKKGRIFVISGPSGVGKGTIAYHILQQMPDNFQYSISMTTRDPRPNEIDGKDYYFVSVDEFKNQIEQGNLLEWASYSGNYYGTPAGPIYELLDQGINVCLEIETQGALQIKETDPDAFLIFIMPPSIKALKQRLAGRNTETEDAINLRLETMMTEMQTVDKYDYIVVNDEVKETVEKLLKVMNR